MQYLFILGKGKYHSISAGGNMLAVWFTKPLCEIGTCSSIKRKQLYRYMYMYKYTIYQSHHLHHAGLDPGGGTQIWFRRGCAAEAAKPVPIFKGHFGGKGYPLLGVWRKRVPIIRGFYSRKWCFVYFSDEMGENISSIYSKITKVGACLGIFPAKVGGMFRGFLGKKSPISAAHPRSPY